MSSLLLQNFKASKNKSYVDRGPWTTARNLPKRWLYENTRQNGSNPKQWSQSKAVLHRLSTLPTISTASTDKCYFTAFPSHVHRLQRSSRIAIKLPARLFVIGGTMKRRHDTRWSTWNTRHDYIRSHWHTNYNKLRIRTTRWHRSRTMLAHREDSLHFEAGGQTLFSVAQNMNTTLNQQSRGLSWYQRTFV